jgi:hypothetical protein
VDSNVTTALTALILYRVGTDPVKGFAVTLLIGLGASMFAAIFVTRTLFMIWLRRSGSLARLKHREMAPLTGARFDFSACAGGWWRRPVGSSSPASSCSRCGA